MHHNLDNTNNITGRSNLVIFDFSGTLSLGAVLFGKDKTMRQALKNSGFDALGIDNPETFWNDLVIPTWEEGSTTTRGYCRVLAERAEQLLRSGSNKPDREVINKAAFHFVNAYFSYSLIDPSWGSSFQFLNNSKDTDTVIATDHYAEATGHIIKEIQKMGLKAAPLEQALRQEKFFIASSADLGFSKTRQEFWNILKQFLCPGFYKKILLIDDFGFNEQEDFYGGKTKALKRRQKVSSLVENTFTTKPITFSFFLEQASQNGEGLSKSYLDLIEKAHLFLETNLRT